MGHTYAKLWLCPLSFQKHEPVRSALKAQHSDWECGLELGTWRQMWGLNHEFWGCATPLTHPWEPFESCRAWGKLILCLSGSSSPKTLPCPSLVFPGCLQKGHMTGQGSVLFWSVKFLYPTLSVGGVCPETLGGSFRTFLEHRQFLLVSCFYNWKLNLLWLVTKWTPKFIVDSQVSWASLTDVIYKLWRGHLTLEGHLLTGVFLVFMAVSTDPSGWSPMAFYEQGSWAWHRN